MVSASKLALLAGAALASARPSTSVSDGGLPARYNGSSAGGTFLYGAENSSPYEQVPVQALDSRFIFTRTYPDRVCPCSSQFGAKNFTAYYGGGTTDAPTLQLFTSSPGEQTVYVDRDFSVRYTQPGIPIPPGANATSITSVDPEPLGGGLPNSGNLVANGYVTQANGTKTPYNEIIFCLPPGGKPGTLNKAGPLTVSVYYSTALSGSAPPGCIIGSIYTTVNAPQVAEYDIAFRAPQKPAAFFYL